MRGSTCKREGCGLEFHACSSCDIMNWEYDYCSMDCYTEAKNEAFRKIAEKHGIDVSKIDGLADDLSEWVEHY